MSDEWVPRAITEQVLEAIATRPALLLTGLRQAGKSSLLQNLLPDYSYIAFDNVNLARAAEEDPSAFLESFTKPVILDEAQYVPSLFRELKIKIDTNRKRLGFWVLTGSQNLSLLNEASESLSGRLRILHLNTLSAYELNNPKIKSKNTADILWKGGFPELWSNPNIKAQSFYEDYVATYLERDLRRILQVENLRDFQLFLKSCALRVGQIVNFTEISRDIGVSSVTIKKWVQVLEASGLLILLTPYYKNLGKRLIKAPKLYFADNGILCHLLGIHSKEQLKDNPLEGSIWENFVLNSILSNEKIKIGYQLFYLRDQNGVEIDFVLEAAKSIVLIEAKKNENPDERKLNFHKIAPLFLEKNVFCHLACNSNEKMILKFKDYSKYNPLFVAGWEGVF